MTGIFKQIQTLSKLLVYFMKVSSLAKVFKKSRRLFQIVRQSGVTAGVRSIKNFIISRYHFVQNPAGAVEWSEARIYFNTPGIPANSYESHYESDEDFSNYKTDIKALAFYLPQFHTFPENDQWWGKGFTDWTNTRKAQPRYPSHYQPREPHDDIGYYDLSDCKTLQKQAEMLRKHGLYGLCIYHYWFSGKRLMEKPLDILMEHPEIDLKFCLCWANENWTRTWDGLDNEVLIAQKHENYDIDYIKDLKKYVMDPRYIRINGEPVILVYRPDVLPDPEKTFSLWRQWAAENGIGRIRIWCVRGCASSPASLLVNGADAEVEFPPAYTVAPMVLKTTENNSQILYYPGCVADILAGRGCVENFKHPVYRSAMLGWDCTPRRKAFHGWYGFSPERYYNWLRYNIKYTRKHHEKDERFIFINAWNEWAEGTYLEPDKTFGYTNLNTTSRALFDLPLEFPESTGQLLENVSSSLYFDRKWYLEQYADIAAAKIDPLSHFALSGWKEGRSPSEKFPNALYLFFNPELRQKELNSILDFQQRGLSQEYLTDCCREFDRIQKKSRKDLKIELLVPRPAPGNMTFDGIRTAVHLHCFYTDMIPEIIGYLQHIPCKFDLFVSLPRGRNITPEQLKHTFCSQLPGMEKCDIRICPNRGRDIAPMIAEFGKDLLNYDYFCHIHTKKSLHTPAHAAWAGMIYEHLFRDKEWMKRIFALLKGGAAVVYPRDFLMMKEEPSGWGSNINIAQKFLDRCGKSIDLQSRFPVIEFPQGSMFWAQVSAMKELLSLELKYEDFPEEPLGTDGTLAHALERLFFIWCMEHPGKICQIFFPEEKELIRKKRYWYPGEI
ncbi:MAG: hypothetical protein E7048_07580 [Lentisphaerae bacterium]|nr:hypothetical protein [Lentisphaerota bacterium]